MQALVKYPPAARRVMGLIFPSHTSELKLRGNATCYPRGVSQIIKELSFLAKKLYTLEIAKQEKGLRVSKGISIFGGAMILVFQP